MHISESVLYVFVEHFLFYFENLVFPGVAVLLPLYGPSSHLSWCVSPVSCFPAYLNPPHCVFPFRLLYPCFLVTSCVLRVTVLFSVVGLLPDPCLFGWLNQSFCVWPPASYWIKNFAFWTWFLCLASSFCTLTVNYTEEFEKPSSFLMKTWE